MGGKGRMDRRESQRGRNGRTHTPPSLSPSLSLSLSLARGWNVPESFEEAVVEMDAEAVEAESGGIGRGRSGREEEEEEEEIGGIRWRVEVWEVVGRYREGGDGGGGERREGTGFVLSITVLLSSP